LKAPREADWLDAKHLAKFLHFNTSKGQLLEVNRRKPFGESKLVSDASWADGEEDYRSCSGRRLKVNGYRVGYGTGIQPGLPALSSGESELRAMSQGSCELLFVIHILRWMGIEMGVKVEAIVANDASAALANARKLGPGRMRHVETQALFLKGLVRNGTVRLEKNTSQDNTADLHTKKLPAARFLELSKMIGVCTCDVNKFPKLQMKRVNVIADIRKLAQSETARA
jgi:hypothetical protein